MIQDRSLISSEDIERFEKKYLVCTETNCWGWIAATNSGNTQGVITWQNSSYSSRRFSYLLYAGNIPLKIEVKTTCGNLKCVNPEHLYLNSETPEKRFSRKYKVNKKTDCWVWVAGKNGNGYGAFRHKGKMLDAHRFSYQLCKGEIPKGLEIDHLCRNRACVNTDHLEVVTKRENILRGIGPTAINALENPLYTRSRIYKREYL